jgi:glycosidase
LLKPILLSFIAASVFFGCAEDKISSLFSLRHQQHYRQVVVAGSFNNWQTDEHYLKNVNGNWQLSLPLAQGRYEYRFFINDSIWIKDPANPYWAGEKSNSIRFVAPNPLPDMVNVYPAQGDIISQTESPLWFVFKDADIIKSNTIELSVNGQELQTTWRGDTLHSTVNFDHSGYFSWYLNPGAAEGMQLATYRGAFVRLDDRRQNDYFAGFPDIYFSTTERITLNAGLSAIVPAIRIENAVWQANRKQLDNENKFVFEAKSHLIPGHNPLSFGNEVHRDFNRKYLLNAGIKATTLRFNPLNDHSHTKVETVHLVGDFNRWQLQEEWAFKNAGEFFTISKALPGGIYEYKIVVNGTDWMADPGNSERIGDGWQGKNSVLRVKGETTKISPADKIIQYSKRIPARFVSSDTEKVFKVSTAMDTHTLKIRKKITGSGSDVDLYLSPAWADTAIIYEIFVRLYGDGKPGRFADIAKRIPYLKSLGVNTVWFMPVYDGPTDHGYAPTSYFAVEEDYGTLEEFKQLVASMQRAGIRVIFDFVANHSSDQHPFFIAAQRESSFFRQWYLWDDHGHYHYNADWDVLPDLNWQNPYVRNQIMASALFWLEAGIDGYRCDAAWGVPHDFWKEFRIVLKAENPDVLLIDEVLPRQPEYHDYEFDASYDTDFYGNILDLYNGRKDVEAFVFGLLKTQANFPAPALGLRYLENHDMPRFIHSFNREKTLQASTLLFISAGMPLIYHGQEIGLKQMREDMIWNPNAAQKALLEHYKKLIRIRKKLNIRALSRLNYRQIDNKVLVVSDRNFAAYFNFSNSAVTISHSGQLLYGSPTEKTKDEYALYPSGFALFKP